MRRFTVPLVLIAGLGLMLWGCSEDDGGTGPTGPTLAGTWGTQLVVGTDTIYVSLVCGTSAYTLAADTTNAGQADPWYYEEGLYTYDGDSATFTPDTCMLAGQPYVGCMAQTAAVGNDTIAYNYMGTIPVTIVKQP
jgi:hypothetical protein